MPGSLTPIVVGLLVVTGIVVSIIIWRHRRGRTHEGTLGPILAERGLTLLSMKTPGFFSVGPFPKIELRSGRPQSRVLGVQGEYNAYRIVELADGEGNRYRLWALLEFELFKLARVRWRVEAGAPVPPAARDLIEN
jgi:hypothetical protein